MHFFAEIPVVTQLLVSSHCHQHFKAMSLLSTTYMHKNMKNVCVCECECVYVIESERVVAIIEEVASVRKCLQRANSCFASRQTDYTVKRK